MSVLGHSKYVLVPLLLGVTPGCGVREDVVATVGGYSVEVDVLQSYMDGVVDLSWQAVDERVASRLLDQYLDQEVVVAAASDQRGVEVPPEFAARSAAVRSLLRDVCGEVPPVPQEVLDAEIESRLDEIHPARAHVRQMLLDSLEAATFVRARLVDGEAFEDVSRQVSRAPNAETGGELGYVEQGTLPPDLDGVIFALAAGEISTPVSSPAGYHIFQVLEVVPEGPAERSRLELEVHQTIAESFACDFTDKCVDRLATEVGVTVFPKHLWFSYDGKYAEKIHEE
jgi:hypothetical protein